MAEYIKTRTGHQLNTAMLSLGELKQIRRTRAITPQEFVRSEKDGFVFLVRDPATGKRTEAKVKKIDGMNAAFQGLYLAPNGQLIVLRSFLEPKQVFAEFRTYSLCAYKADFRAGSIKEGYYSAIYGIHFDPEKNEAIEYHRRVNVGIEKQGIGSEMYDRIEKAMAAMGATRLIVANVRLPGKTQTETIKLLERRGYAFEGDEFGGNSVRRLPDAREDFDFARYHSFPTKPSGPRKYYSELIK